MKELVCENIEINASGRLTFAGQDTVTLAARYGTPLYLMDEDRIRHNMRVYTEAFGKYFPEGSRVVYGSKACAFKQMYRITAEEGCFVDVVSPGEIYSAYTAGFPMENAYFHGNNKSDEDIAFAMDKKIGWFVVDNREEIEVIQREAARRGIRQKVLLRLTPGIDTHTYAAVNTGLVDSKFGTAIETGQAEEYALFTLSQPNVDMRGFHCHVGSQVFAEDVFERSAVIMLDFIADFAKKHGYSPDYLDLGGGYGVRYVASDPHIDIDKKIKDVADAVNARCAELNIPVPKLIMEPGRSIVADAGMTLYTVGTVKRIPGYKNYVSIDGGMSDNPRFALYGSQYTVFTANKAGNDEPFIADLVGRCCESGDVIAEKVPFPASVGRGDTVAVCTTGAYNYSMASNYNRVARPAVVMLKGGKSYVAVRRESLEDMAALDV